MKIEDIEDTRFLKQMNTKELENLSQDIRYFLIQNISKTGGHLSSNLGIVELTVALHKQFDSPKDKIIFDVGHQAYVHKILTGRAKDFKTLRQYNGLSGFQKRYESSHDAWEAGHSSTVLSGGIGLAAARDLNHEDGEVICVIGDGAIMSGESFEALNHLGSLKNKVIVVLNDNDMSISKNVGGMSDFLSEVRISSQYKQAKSNYATFLKKFYLGQKFYSFTKKIKDHMKKNVLADNLFSQFGLDYIGPVDGHNFKDLNNALQSAKLMDHSVVVHVHTIKGKGYSFAENDHSGKYHGVAPFNISEGIKSTACDATWSQIISSHIEKWMKYDKDIVVITPAMIEGSCLKSIFKHYPDRSFDCGIAEEHATTFAAGLAVAGKKPYLTIYSSFLQRAYDQINHDIARMNLPCLIGIDRAGLVGNDGETHHGVFDISFLSAIPGIVLMTPRNAKEAKMMINTAYTLNDKPYLMRFPKGKINDKDVNINETLEVGKWEKVIFDSSNKLTIITYDQKVDQVFSLIKDRNINLINARFIKPMDNEMLLELAELSRDILIYESDQKIGSLGAMIAHFYADKDIHVQLHFMAIADQYTPQGSIEELLRHDHISQEDLLYKIKEILGEERKN